MVWTGSEADKRSMKRHKERKFLIGLCVTCGKNPRPEGKRVCRECIVKGYNARRPLVAKKIAEGICSNCLGRPAKPHRRMCHVCTERGRLGPDGRLKRRCKDRGITVEQYNVLLEKQFGKCLICGDIPTEKEKQLAIDHCHIKGHVRGLLCMPCNSAIGLLKDNYEVLQKAAAYLKENRKVV